MLRREVSLVIVAEMVDAEPLHSLVLWIEAWVGPARPRVYHPRQTRRGAIEDGEATERLESGRPRVHRRAVLLHDRGDLTLYLVQFVVADERFALASQYVRPGELLFWCQRCCSILQGVGICSAHCYVILLRGVEIARRRSRPTSLHFHLVPLHLACVGKAGVSLQPGHIIDRVDVVELL